MTESDRHPVLDYQTPRNESRALARTIRVLSVSIVILFLLPLLGYPLFLVALVLIYGMGHPF